MWNLTRPSNFIYYLHCRVLPDPASRINARWTNEELLLAVQVLQTFTILTFIHKQTKQQCKSCKSSLSFRLFSFLVSTSRSLFWQLFKFLVWIILNICCREFGSLARTSRWSPPFWAPRLSLTCALSLSTTGVAMIWMLFTRLVSDLWAVKDRTCWAC